MKERRPIFYDAERVRWRRTRRVLEISGLLLAVLLAYFFVTIAVSVELPAGLLPETRPAYRALKIKKKTPAREGRHRRISNIGTVPASYDPLRAAFFVSWDAASFASLKKHYKDIDVLIPDQLHAVTPDGALTIVDYERYQTVKASPTQAIAILRDDKLHRWMKSANIELPIMGLLDNYDGRSWRVKEMAAMLGNKTARQSLVRDVVDYTVGAHQAGVVVDFEEVPDATQPHFREFAAELGPALHSVGLKLMIALPARDDAYDYKFFGKECDAVVLMNYDQHWLTSPPGPVAAQDWFVENLRQVLEDVPAQKVVVGIANYAYDWPEGTKKRNEGGAKEMSVQEALLHAYESETEVEFDPASMNPHYSYSDEHDHTHQVWMLDAVTAYNQLRACERMGVQGTALWRFGSSDTSIWPVWDSPRPDDTVRAKIKDIPPGPDLILEGDGDVWHFTDTPKSGLRSFEYDARSDLFTSETYEKYPLSYNIDQIGAADNKIALTFDDGPDIRWTPKILDILKEKHVPATFFVIGVDASQFPQIVKREYAEGHEIGNHTYTHPSFDDISKTEIHWQLNLTQRLIESTIGVKSILFRPPYGIDHQPEYAEEVAQLPLAQDMGYLIVGQKIDAHDWRQVDGKQIPAQEIVDNVVRQAGMGNIVLFHDGGGERANTVAALPQVIDKLREEGYQFVSVPDLLGKKRAEVMMPLSAQEKLEARADSFIFGLWHWFRVSIATIFIVGIVMVSGRALIIGILALIEKLRPDHLVLPNPPPGVSVLIPAHNEETVIVQTVKSVLASDLKDLQVIVVNDGSIDRTGELLDGNFGQNPRVRILHQVNRGKAAALSRALGEAQTEIVVTIDADTEIEPDAISKLLRHFSDEKVGAVAGNVKVGNRSRWLTRWQALEYVTSQVDYDEEAIAWTEAPETPGMLIRKRFRWTFGTLQSFWKHKGTLFRPKYGTLGMVALPNIFVFQLLLPLISPIIDLLFLGSVIAWALAQYHIIRLPLLSATATSDLERSVLFFVGFLLIDMLTCVLAFALEKKEDWTLLVPVLLQRFYYRQLMYVVLFRSVKEAVSGRPVGWRGVEPEAPRTVAPA